ncbi:uncharacterized protein LY79DRAFT_132743 [Colletotrichum navitas]|uniref:Uncharacterized protein n=1 Tax=Colletotrichum navitas TaxID=681940 RepID=A0AAD8Q3J6_9PEZI|nr:uncharacterized protein LY79DRAFT_132743 [Colletotrichum navitas]KAK1594581.1 hypothetical protein LY79DRAFT_132743 [Colletotrichum navitas]
MACLMEGDHIESLSRGPPDSPELPTAGVDSSVLNTSSGNNASFQSDKKENCRTTRQLSIESNRSLGTQDSSSIYSCSSEHGGSAVGTKGLSKCRSRIAIPTKSISGWPVLSSRRIPESTNVELAPDPAGRRSIESRSMFTAAMRYPSHAQGVMKNSQTIDPKTRIAEQLGSAR